jgi:hypothetical protein
MALAAFFYFFPTGWGTRQSWAHSDFRHELVLDGLPVNDEVKDTEGHVVKDKISDADLKQIFPGGNPVRTQTEEVNRVRGSVDADRALEMLKTMARTGSERDEVFEYQKLKQQGEKAVPDKARKEYEARKEYLENKFQDPKAIVFDEVDKAKNPGALRSAIAHVLFNSYEKDDKERRLPIVVGLKEFSLEVNQEADALVSMTARVRRGMQRDLSAFEGQYPQLIKDIQVLNDKIEDSKKQLEFQEQLRMSHNSLVMRRIQDVEALKKAIFDARQATRQAMETLTKEQKLYFQAEAETGQRAKENLDFEREIRKKEHAGE